MHFPRGIPDFMLCLYIPECNTSSWTHITKQAPQQDRAYHYWALYLRSETQSFISSKPIQYKDLYLTKRIMGNNLALVHFNSLISYTSLADYNIVDLASKHSHVMKTVLAEYSTTGSTGARHPLFLVSEQWPNWTIIHVILHLHFEI